MSEEGGIATTPPQNKDDKPKGFFETLTGRIVGLTAFLAALYGLWTQIQQFIPKHEEPSSRHEESEGPSPPSLAGAENPAPAESPSSLKASQNMTVFYYDYLCKKCFYLDPDQ